MNKVSLLAFNASMAPPVIVARLDGASVVVIPRRR
jgi:hypothetical protein